MIENLLLFLKQNATIILLFVAPLLSMLIGIYRKREENGAIFFMVGWFLFSCSLSVFCLTSLVASFICAFLRPLGISATFTDTTKLGMLLTLLLLYPGYRLFVYIRYFESRKYRAKALTFILDGQSPSLPDCSKVIMEKFKERILYKKPSPSPSNAEVFSSQEVYNTCISLLASGNFNFLYGPLTDEGEQFTKICEFCLEYLVENGIINENEKQQYISNIHHASYSGTLINTLLK